MIPSRIYLCGFMGSGKSTVGPMLAQRLEYGFADTDLEIERLEGRSIREIFDERGESYFRQQELLALNWLTNRKSLVVALGGGILLDTANAQLVRKSGFLVYLRTSLTTLKRRLKGTSDRPLLRKTVMDELFEARRAGYESSDYVVDTDTRTPNQVVENILTSAFYEL